MNDLTIMIGQLGHVWLTNREEDGEKACKQTTQETLINKLSSYWSTKQPLIDQ